MKRMTKKISKRTYIIGVTLTLLLLGVVFTMLFSKYTHTQEVRNVRLMNGQLARVASLVEGAWRDESMCKITNAGQVGSRDHYMCEAKHKVTYEEIEKDKVANFIHDQALIIARIEAIEAFEKGAAYDDGDSVSHSYGFHLRDVDAGDGKCLLRYIYNKRQAVVSGELGCSQEVSEKTYDELMKLRI